MFFNQSKLEGRCNVISGLISFIAVFSFALVTTFAHAQPIDIHGIYLSNVLDGEVFAKQINASRSPVSNEQAHEITAQERTEQKRIWMLSRSDLSLRRAVMHWVQLAGWRLQWDAAWDTPILHDTRFEGDFSIAIHNVISTLAAAHLFALIDDENRVVRITTIGLE